MRDPAGSAERTKPLGDDFAPPKRPIPKGPVVSVGQPAARSSPASGTPQPGR
jgi:hypothetical protein